MERSFANPPDGSGFAIIGRVTVSAIPEASAFAALAFVSAVVGAWQVAKRKCSHHAPRDGV